MKPIPPTAPGLIFGITVLFSTGSALAECERVRGRIVSDQVTVFSNGHACPSPLGLCTEGRFSGDLKGRFRFVASTLTPFDSLDSSTASDVAAVTGVNRLRPKEFCDGILVFADTSAFSLSPDGFVGGLETIDSLASTGACEGVSGRIRIEGVFVEGCVDCTYKGEVCADGDDDKGEDDD